MDFEQKIPTQQLEVEAYTKLRRKTLRKLLVSLVRKGQLNKQDLETVIDLGSYEGSSTMALRDVGAESVISVDSNRFALDRGTQAGYINNPVESDVVDYVKDMDKSFRGTVTAFNCILYLPEEDVYRIINILKEKLASGSKFVFTFSKTQEDWVPKFREALNQNFSNELLTGLTSGELDSNCFVATKI